MDARRNEISPTELASEASSLLAGLGILSMALFPFAVPALVLGLVLVLPLIVLVPPVLAIWLLVGGVARLVRRARPRPTGNQADALPEPRQDPPLLRGRAVQIADHGEHAAVTVGGRR